MSSKESGLVFMNFNTEAYNSNFDLGQYSTFGWKQEQYQENLCRVEMGGGRTFQILTPGQQSGNKKYSLTPP
jgi:hypothetical protein